MTITVSLLVVGVADALIKDTKPPTIVLGALDEPAHVATTVLLVVAVARRAPAGFVVAAVIASVGLDLDHVPGYLGTDALTAGTPRPYSHSLATVMLLSAGAVLARGGGRAVLAGVAFGVLAHLIRDTATGTGVALLWPLSSEAVRVSYGWYAGGVVALAAAGVLVRPRTEREIQR